MLSISFGLIIGLVDGCNGFCGDIDGVVFASTFAIASFTSAIAPDN